MRDKKQKSKLDKDFLWLFRDFEKAAIYLSLDYHIIDFTTSAEVLFAIERKKVLRKPVSSIFSLFGIKIDFIKRGKKVAVSVAASGVTKNSHKAQKICELGWEIKPKIASSGKTEGFIVYAKEHPDVGYLSQVYKVVSGQNNITHKSLKNYAEDIKDYLENIIANLPGNIYWLDKNCIYLGCNNNAARFVGLKSRKEAVGLSYEDMERKAGWTAGHTKSWQHDDLEVITTGKPKLNVEEKPVLLPNGQEIYYLTSRVPLFDKEKNVIGVLGVSIDITERKLMEKELDRARKDAEAERQKKEQGISKRMSELMKMLSSSIAHELRTPLAIIGINTDLLKISPVIMAACAKEKEAIEKNFSSIKHAISLASHVIDNVLVMLKTLTSGTDKKNSFNQLSIADDITRMLQTYPFLASEKSLIKVEFDKIKDFSYQGDKVLTQNILFNLLRNALQAIKEAEKGEIKISLGIDGNYNILKFSDTSLGIAKDMLPHIFEQFASKKQLGAGLGLAFCNMVMETYGGDITCTSELGTFTEFTLRFPRIN